MRKNRFTASNHHPTSVTNFSPKEMNLMNDLSVNGLNDLSQLSPSPSDEKNPKIIVCVRKRPLFHREKEIDCIRTTDSSVSLVRKKLLLDGITKNITKTNFNFSKVFNEKASNQYIFKSTVSEHLNKLMRSGRLTVFTYGQTGSGKSYTVNSLMTQTIDELYKIFNCNKYNFSISYFEIYFNQLYDILNNNKKIFPLEGYDNIVQIKDLKVISCKTAKEMKSLLGTCQQKRRTSNNITNETSSRSHAICNILISKKDSPNVVYSKIIFADLAGSERANEVLSTDSKLRAEGASINKSLFSLKECIRSTDYIPFRSSKLTLVLRDSFLLQGENDKIIMIACVSPEMKSAHHSINTLQYAERIYEERFSSTSKRALSRGNSCLKKRHFLISEESNLLQKRFHSSLKMKKNFQNIEMSRDTTYCSTFRGSSSMHSRNKSYAFSPIVLKRTIKHVDSISPIEQDELPPCPFDTILCNFDTLNNNGKIYPDEATYINEDISLL